MADGPTQQHTAREQIEDEAASWLLRLGEAPDDARLRDELAAWRGQSALHAEVWDRTCQAYDLLGKAPPAHEEHWKRYATARAPSPTAARAVRRRRPLRAAAAVVALAACLALFILPGLLVRWNADVATATAELRVIVLDDGSRVHMAPQSAIDIAFTDRERRLRLLSGQAYFEVQRDAARPFTVKAGDVLTTVLGTRFDVRLEEAGVSVAVREGRVRVADVRSPAAAHDLQAGDMLRLGASGSATLGAVTPADVGDWSEGRLVARHRPVAEIVDRLRSYYGGMVVLADEAFARLEVSGVYDPADPVATLDNLARLHGSTVRRLSPWLVVVTPY